MRRITEWASDTETGDRDDLRPGVPERSWAQVSVSARECLGPARCPYAADCFAEKARAEAGRADIVVTNHALLAIDAIAEAEVLPEHDFLIVDEAHELTDRVTSVATGELTGGPLGVTVRRTGRLVGPELTERLDAAVATFTSAIHDAQPGRIDFLDDELRTYLTALRDAAAAARSAINPAPGDPKAAAARAESVAALSEISDTAARVLDSFGPAIPDRADVVWLDHEEQRGAQPSVSGSATRPVLRVAPLSVAGLLAGQVFGTATAVLTSATLTVGGSFDAMADGLGTLRRAGLAGVGRRVALRPCQVRDSLYRRAPARTRPRRRGIGRATRRDRRADRGRGRAHAGVVLVDAGGSGRGRGDATPPGHPGPVPG